MTKKIAPKGSSEAFLRAHVGYTGDDCLLWPFRTDQRGYGLAVIEGKQRHANNWMCRLVYGAPFSIWNHAAHRCGNARCVNPKHLRWASPRENMLDKNIHGTSNRGERNGKTTLTEADVIAIREAPAKLAPLMAKYGMSKYGISRIRAGKRWAHVGGPLTSRQRGHMTTCWNGHPFNEANTHWSKDGYRNCRVCDRERAKVRRQKPADAQEEPSP